MVASEWLETHVEDVVELDVFRKLKSVRHLPDTFSCLERPCKA